MTQCLCLVQEGQISSEVALKLKQRLSSLSERAFGVPAEFQWQEVAKGNGFTASKPSTSSIVSMTAPYTVPQAERVEYLSQICAIWMKETNCSLDEIVAAVNDPAQA